MGIGNLDNTEVYTEEEIVSPRASGYHDMTRVKNSIVEDIYSILHFYLTYVCWVTSGLHLDFNVSVKFRTQDKGKVVNNSQVIL